MRSFIDWLDSHKKWLIIPAIGIIMVMLIPSLGSLSAEDIAHFTPSSIPLAVLVFLGIYSLKAFVMIIPLVALYMAAGVVFPAGWAIVITYGCLLAELTIGYIHGKRLGKDRVQKAIARNKRAADFFSSRRDNLSSLCFISRILPIPF